jgi:mono/diheme cytochrome c family protein
LLKRIIASGVLLALGACASTQQQSLDWGRQLAQGNCATCHAIAPGGGSPNPFAPAFRDLRRTYPLATIEKTFAPGQINDHPPMPSFAMRPEDMRDLLAYIKSVQAPPNGPWLDPVRRRD